MAEKYKIQNEQKKILMYLGKSVAFSVLHDVEIHTLFACIFCTLYMFVICFDYCIIPRNYNYNIVDVRIEGGVVSVRMTLREYEMRSCPTPLS